MQLTLDQIREYIADGRIGALTVDTEVFDRAGLRLESGVLGQLHALRATGLRFILSAIVHEEVTTHLRLGAAEAIRNTRKSLKELSNYWNPIPAEMTTTISAIDSVSDEGRVQADYRLQRFLMSVGASVIPTGLNADIDAVVRAYFDKQPPFAAGKKKSEFPDALSLSALEGWARKNNTLILAVSGDGDWKAVCDASPSLVLVDDLATALTCCQPKIARDLAANLTAEASLGNMPQFMTDLAERIDRQGSQLYVDAYYDSVFFAEDEIWVDEVTMDDSRSVEFDPLSFENRTLVVRAKVSCSIHTSGSISFSVKDPIDKDMVSMGSTSVEQVVDDELEVVIGINISSDEPWTITRVDVAPQRVSVDYGNVQPDWMSEQEHDDAGA